MTNAAPNHDDPLAPMTLATRRWRNAACVLVPLVAVWALWPAKPSNPSRPPEAPAAQKSSRYSRPALQLAAFDAPIWTLDPPPPTQTAPPPPLRLQLVGVMRDGGGQDQPGVLKAVVYDPDTDALIVVAEGAKIGTPVRTVVKIDAAGITLSDAAGTRRLLLEPTP